MAGQQIKSRERVAERGEVFTAEREVNAMLDLVKQETERIDSRFLEPACGTGNFLVEILRRKLNVVQRQYLHQVAQMQLQSVIAVSNIYGIDIMMDNVEECRQRLFVILCRTYYGKYGLKTIRDIVSRWAPAKENNTEAYIRHVSDYTGISPNKVLGSPQEHPTQWLLIGYAMAVVENGKALPAVPMLKGFALAIEK